MMNNDERPTDDTKDTDSFLKTMRQRFQLASEALTDVHSEALLDFEYRLGGEGQWDARVLSQRKRDGRPCYSVNRIPEFVRQVTGTQKKNRPAIRCSPIGDGADVETARIEQGLIRHIEGDSNASDAYDTAFDHMATGGFGYFRLVTQYEDDDSDNQEIMFAREPNPFSHYPDPRCKTRDYSDARYWFVIDDMSVEDFQEQFPGSSLQGLTEFSAVANQAPDWIQRDSIRVAEYFWIEETKRKTKKGKRQRTDKTVHWCLTNGIEILEEEIVPGKYIPIVPVLGEELIVKGKRYLIGIVRNARTPQTLYNLWQSARAEMIALAPKSPIQATPAQIEGFEEIYENANTSNYPVLPYNPDAKADGKPSRNVAEQPIQGINQAIQGADNDLKSTTGLYNASLGAPGPEQSGKAILLRKTQGENSTFAFQDAMNPAIKHAGRIIIGWIPAYYDAERVIRIVEPDRTSKTVKINAPFLDEAGLPKVFDLTVGKYDVSVSDGPSYESARQEAAESIMGLIQANPELMQVCGDLLVQNFDWPMAQEISERLKKMLPPQLQDQKVDPQQLQTKLAQAQQMIQQMTAALHKLAAQAESKTIEAASRERIALINARAGVIEALIKAQSAEAMLAFQSELEQIDRQLSLIPDPAVQPDAGAGGQPQQAQAQPQQPQPQPQPQPPAA